MSVRHKSLLMGLLLILPCTQVVAAEDSVKTFHFGFLHPNGIDLIGYSVETPMDNKLYWYYTIGLPSILAAGFTRYSNRDGNGMTTTVGVGLFVLAYASVGYQFKLSNKSFLKLGAGIAVEYLGSQSDDDSDDEKLGVYPAPILSYEYRF